jgi:hypothetical protein
VEGQLKEILQRLGQINKPPSPPPQQNYLRPRTQSELNSVYGKNNQSANSLHFAYQNEQPTSIRVKATGKNFMQGGN